MWVEYGDVFGAATLDHMKRVSVRSPIVINAVDRSAAIGMIMVAAAAARLAKNITIHLPFARKATTAAFPVRFDESRVRRSKGSMSGRKVSCLCQIGPCQLFDRKVRSGPMKRSERCMDLTGVNQSRATIGTTSVGGDVQQLTYSFGHRYPLCDALLMIMMTVHGGGCQGISAAIVTVVQLFATTCRSMMQIGQCLL